MNYSAYYRKVFDRKKSKQKCQEDENMQVDSEDNKAENNLNLENDIEICNKKKLSSN